MVCRDAHTHRARPVNSLIITTPEEEKLFKTGEGWQFLVKLYFAFIEIPCCRAERPSKIERATFSIPGPTDIRRSASSTFVLSAIREREFHYSRC